MWAFRKGNRKEDFVAAGDGRISQEAFHPITKKPPPFMLRREGGGRCGVL
jgi:hypothetical protein